jgi:hypothetical protein
MSVESTVNSWLTPLPSKWISGNLTFPVTRLIRSYGFGTEFNSAQTAPASVAVALVRYLAAA